MQPLPAPITQGEDSGFFWVNLAGICYMRRMATLKAKSPEMGLKFCFQSVTVFG
jgi:hypothetical protein